jgi:hypothetical protein
MSAPAPADAIHRLRVWHLVVIAFVLALIAAVAAAVVCRQMGLGQYRAVLAKLKAAGQPTTIDDFIAWAPEVDISDQEAFARWMKGYVGISRSRTSDDEDAWNAWVSGHAPEPAGIRAKIDGQRAAMAEALTVLRHGRLVLSTLGWAAQALPPDERHWPGLHAIQQTVNQPAVFDLIAWLHHDTVLSADPAQGLRDLDALHTATGRPGSVYDAWHVSIVCDAFRDRTYVELALRNQLPAAARERWLAEPARSLVLMADAFRGARLFDLNFSVDFCENGPGRRPHIDAHWRFLPDHLSRWLTAFGECAYMAEVEAGFEARLRDEHSAAPPTSATVNARLNPFSHIAFPNLFEFVHLAVDDDANHRIGRLAMRILALAHGGALPADGAELAQRLGEPHALDPGGDHLRLLYERLGNRRFRLTSDPASPTPGYYDASRLTRGRPTASPSPQPYRWFPPFELELPP